MDHYVESCLDAFANTPFSDSFVLYHDALTSWWEEGAQKHLLEKNGIGPDRQLCAQGDTNDQISKRYVGKLTGNMIPTWFHSMPTSSPTTNVTSTGPWATPLISRMGTPRV